MTSDEKGAGSISTDHAWSVEEIQRLIRTIDRKLILDWFKHHPNNSFSYIWKGFRLQEQNWSHIAKKLASSAVHDEELMQFLTFMWTKTNEELCNRIKEHVQEDDVEGSLCDLFLLLDDTSDTITRLWCGLSLDGRKSVQDVLNNGLREALLNETSPFSFKVQLARKSKVLAESQQTIRDLRSELQQKQREYEGDLQEKQRIYEACEEERSRQGETINTLSHDLEGITAEHERLLQESVATLEEEKIRYDLLEKEARQVKGELHLVNEKINAMYDENCALSRGKEQLLARLHEVEHEWNRSYDEQRQEIPSHLQAKKTLSPASLDAAWSQAFHTLSQYFSFAYVDQSSERQSIAPEEKFADWQRWQKDEEDLLRSLLLSSQEMETTSLLQIEAAQKLLMLRWYLLEWIRSVQSEALLLHQSDNHKSV